jgi:hypothetical protein
LMMISFKTVGDAVNENKLLRQTIEKLSENYGVQYFFINIFYHF